MSTATCINLLEVFGADFQITFDPAYNTRGVPSRCLDPWMMQLRGKGRRVTVFPFGGSRLGVEADGRPGLVKKLLAIPGVELWQDGDREKTLVFDVSLFGLVAAVVRPRKKRRLSEEQRRECIRRLARARSPAST
jgi:hypothetical protein